LGSLQLSHSFLDPVFAGLLRSRERMGEKGWEREVKGGESRCTITGSSHSPKSKILYKSLV